MADFDGLLAKLDAVAPEAPASGDYDAMLQKLDKAVENTATSPERAQLYPEDVSQAKIAEQAQAVGKAQADQYVKESDSNTLGKAVKEYTGLITAPARVGESAVMYAQDKGWLSPRPQQAVPSKPITPADTEEHFQEYQKLFPDANREEHHQKVAQAAEQQKAASLIRAYADRYKSGADISRGMGYVRDKADITDMVGVIDTVRLARAAEAVQKGNASPEDYAIIGKAIGKAEVEHGSGAGEKIVDLAAGLPKLLVQIALTRGVGAGAKKLLAGEAATALAPKTVGLLGEGMLAKAGGYTAQGLAMAAANPGSTLQDTAQAMVPTPRLDEQGKLVTPEGESAFTALPKAFARQAIQFGTMGVTGDAGDALLKSVGSRLGGTAVGEAAIARFNQLPEALRGETAQKAAEFLWGSTSTPGITDQRLAEVIQGAVGLRPDMGVIGDVLSNDEKRRKSGWNQLLAEIVVFGGAHAGRAVGDRALAPGPPRFPLPEGRLREGGTVPPAERGQQLGAVGGEGFRQVLEGEARRQAGEQLRGEPQPADAEAAAGFAGDTQSMAAYRPEADSSATQRLSGSAKANYLAEHVGATAESPEQQQVAHVVTQAQLASNELESRKFERTPTNQAARELTAALRTTASALETGQPLPEAQAGYIRDLLGKGGDPRLAPYREKLADAFRQLAEPLRAEQPQWPGPDRSGQVVDPMGRVEPARPPLPSSDEIGGKQDRFVPLRERLMVDAMDKAPTLASLNGADRRPVAEPAKAVAAQPGAPERVEHMPSAARKLAPEPAGEARPAVERRQDLDRRKAVAEMSPEEMRHELFAARLEGTSGKLTELPIPNARGFHEAERAVKSGAKAFSDSDGLKALNDKFGYDAGNAMLHAKGEVLKEVGLDAYHQKGDEFIYRGASEAELRGKMEMARKLLQERIFEYTDPNGKVRRFVGADFSFGTGADLAQAEAGMHAHKVEREAKGERGPRASLGRIAEIFGPETGRPDQGRTAGADHSPDSRPRSPEVSGTAAAAPAESVQGPARAESPGTAGELRAVTPPAAPIGAALPENLSPPAERVARFLTRRRELGATLHQVAGAAGVSRAELPSIMRELGAAVTNFDGPRGENLYRIEQAAPQRPNLMKLKRGSPEAEEFLRVQQEVIAREKEKREKAGRRAESMSKPEPIPPELEGHFSERDRGNLDQILKMNEAAGLDEGGAAPGDIKGFAGAPVIPTEGRKDAGGNPWSNHAIIKGMEKDFGLKMNVEHVLKNLGAMYDAKPEAMFIRGVYAGHLGITFHEVAHHIDKTNPGILKGLDRATAQELRGLDYDKRRRDLQEGFAEFMRYRLTEGNTGTVAPRAERYFQDWLKGQPEMAKKLDKLQNQVTEWRSASPVERNAPGVLRLGESPETAGQTRLQWLQEKTAKIIKQVIITGKNEGHEVGVFERAGAKQGATYQPGESPEALYRALDRQEGKAAANWAKDGIYSLANDPQGRQRLTRALADASDGLTKEEYKAFVQYGEARHSLELYAEGKAARISLEDAQRIVQQYHSPDFERRADIVHEFAQGLGEVLQKAGYHTKAEFAQIYGKYKHYWPMERAFDESAGLRPGASGTANVPSPVKRRSALGSEAPVIDPIDVLTLRAVETARLAGKQLLNNEIARAADQAEGMGHYVRRLAADDQAARLGGQQGHPVNTPGDHAMVRILDQHDQPHYYHFDKDMMGFAGGAHDVKLHPYIEWGLKPIQVLARGARLFRTGISAGFALANPFRDYKTYLQNVKNLSASEVITAPAVWTARLLRERFGGGQDVISRLYSEMGGEMSHELGMDKASVRNFADVLTGRDKGALARAADGFGKVVDWGRDFLSTTEHAFRISQFEGTMKSLGWDRARIEKEGADAVPLGVLRAALVDSKQVTNDFGRMGSVGRVINSYVPFFNARLEAKANYFQAWGRNPGRMLAITGESIARALGMWWLYKDQDWFQKADGWLKYGNWVLSDGRQAVARVPMHDEHEILAGGLSMAIADSLYRRRPDAFLDWGKQALESFNPGLDLYNWMPVPRVAGRELLDVAVNRDPFRGQPIVDNGIAERRNPENQAEASTTESMKWVTRVLADAGVHVSPAKLQYLVGSLTGDLVPSALHLAEGLAGVKGDRPVQKHLEPDAAYQARLATWEKGKGLDFERLPVVSRFTLRSEYAQDPNTFREKIAEAKQQLGSLQAAGKPPDRAAQRIETLGQLMTPLKALNEGKTDRDERFAVEKYEIGLASAALGKEELPSYPNPLTARDLPPEVKEVRDKWLLTQVHEATAPMPVKKDTETPAHYQSRRQQWQDERERATTLLQEFRLPANEVTKILAQAEAKAGRSTLTDKGGQVTPFGQRLDRLRQIMGN